MSLPFAFNEQPPVRRLEGAPVPCAPQAPCLYPCIEASSEPTTRRAPLELAEISEDIESLEQRIEGLRAQYHIVDKLGSGTFSTVYKALDLHHALYENDEWIEAYARSMAPGALPPHVIRQMDSDQASDPLRSQQPCPRYLRASQYFRQTGKPVYVALKRIFVTSSPARICNELEILALLRGGPSVSHLITAWRSQDQVIAVMPYVRHVDFREYYRIIPVGDLRFYFHSLLSALRWCHALNVIHRDVKPGNFLYNPATGRGTLCDFGLAEMFDPSMWRGNCHHSPPTRDHPHGRTHINDEVVSTHFLSGGMLHPNSRPAAAGQMIGKLPAQTYQHLHANIAIAWSGMSRPGYPKQDMRPSARANRAGTRGFRAPEVLLRCADQTVAIDIWSVGIIMLGFLTKRFPIFNSMDDVEALLELGTIFGKRRMEQVALLHSACPPVRFVRTCF